MSAVAILIGCSAYSSLTPLPCCEVDVQAMSALLKATGNFDNIHELLDKKSDEVKKDLRSIVGAVQNADQIFFYFSGHGASYPDDFYFCMSDFDSRRPNETGLSNAELHNILRDASPKLAVKVIDACNSGTLLVKAGGAFLPQEKGGLTNLVQIASCLDSQTSLTGDPLSEFTDKFCLAASKKKSGQVYYTDIINVLRDEYIDNQDQSPHFVLQASARETFVEDASILDNFRSTYDSTWRSQSAPKTPGGVANETNVTVINPPDLVALLRQTEARLAKPADIPALVNSVFDGIHSRLSSDTFGECFDLEIATHKDFREPTTREFIIRVLNKEKRQDNFVTANYSREYKSNNILSGISSIAFAGSGLFPNDDVVETWDLELNIQMDRAQMRVTLIPKFVTLEKIILVVSCAPSLERCYIFELATRHRRLDWTSFSHEGVEISRHWYKAEWRKDSSWIVDKVVGNIEAAIKNYLDEIAQGLQQKS